MSEGGITEKDIQEIEDAQNAGETLLDNSTLQDLADKWIAGYDAELESIAEQANAEALALLEKEGNNNEQ